MRTMGFLLATFALVPAATAEPTEQQAYVACGIEAGLHVLVETSAVVQAGIRLSGPWLGRVLVGVGTDDALHVGPTPEAYRTYRLGIERERCTAGDRWCGFGGVDFGYHYVTEMDGAELIEHSGADIVGRAGIDVGGGHAYLRATFDVRAGHDNRSSTMNGSSSYTGLTGFALGLAFLVR